MGISVVLEQTPISFPGESTQLQALHSKLHVFSSLAMSSYVQLCPAAHCHFGFPWPKKPGTRYPNWPSNETTHPNVIHRKKNAIHFKKSPSQQQTQHQVGTWPHPPVSTSLHPGAQCDSWDPPWLRPCNAKGPASAPGAEWNSDRAASFPHTRNGYLLHSELENDGKWPSRNSEFSVFPLKMVIFHSYVTVYQRVSSNETSVTGWWYTYPSEKNMTSSIGIIIPNWMEK